MRYSEDYKKRVLDYINEGHTKKQAREILKVSTATIKNWKKRLRETGDLKTITPVRSGWIYDATALAAYVEANPQAYLFEVAEHFGGSVSGALYALERIGITLKKRLLHTQSETKPSGKSLTDSSPSCKEK
jgi:transposase